MEHGMNTEHDISMMEDALVSLRSVVERMQEWSEGCSCDLEHDRKERLDELLVAMKEDAAVFQQAVSVIRSLCSE